MALDMKELAATLKSFEDDIERETADMGLDMRRSTGVEKDPNVVQLLRLFADNPLLPRACLLWALKTQQQLAAAQLEVLYTPEELEQMRKRLDAE